MEDHRSMGNDLEGDLTALETRLAALDRRTAQTEQRLADAERRTKKRRGAYTYERKKRLVRIEQAATQMHTSSDAHYPTSTVSSSGLCRFLRVLLRRSACFCFLHS